MRADLDSNRSRSVLLVCGDPFLNFHRRLNGPDRIDEQDHPFVPNLFHEMSFEGFASRDDDLPGGLDTSQSGDVAVTIHESGIPDQVDEHDGSFMALARPFADQEERSG